MLSPDPRASLRPTPDGPVRCFSTMTTPRRPRHPRDFARERGAANYYKVRQSARGNRIGLRPDCLGHPARDRHAVSEEDFWIFLRPPPRRSPASAKKHFRLLRWGPMAAADFVSETFRDGAVARNDRGSRNFGAALDRGLRRKYRRSLASRRRQTRIRLVPSAFTLAADLAR